MLIPELGAKYRDTVSGFTGIATAYHVYLNGCVQVSLTPEVRNNDKEGNKSWAFDTQQVIRVGGMPARLKKSLDRARADAMETENAPGRSRKSTGGSDGPAPSLSL